MIGFWKPWYVWRPRQILKRVHVAFSPARPGFQELATSWGGSVCADPTKSIGRSVLTTGVYDLTVSETLLRLIDPDDVVIDAGANVGYMTMLASIACGPRGEVLAYEPQREVFETLKKNVELLQKTRKLRNVSLRNCALGDTDGFAWLELPKDFESNDGVARVTRDYTPNASLARVPMRTIDSELGTATARVLKLDVEGFELRVLEGAKRALTTRRITHVVFEEHDINDSSVARFLGGFGYRLYSLGWSVAGLRLGPPSERLAHNYEAPSYLATLAPVDAEARCARRGWRALRSI